MNGWRGEIFILFLFDFNDQKITSNLKFFASPIFCISSLKNLWETFKICINFNLNFALKSLKLCSIKNCLFYLDDNGNKIK